MRLHFLRGNPKSPRLLERGRDCFFSRFTALNQLPSFDLQGILQSSLLWRNLDRRKMSRFALLYEDQKKKLECQCLEILIFAYNGNKLNKLSTWVSDSEFQHASGPELKFRILDPKSFHKVSYNNAWTQLIFIHLYSWWSSLCNHICGGSNATEEALELYLRKFVKRRCVYHLIEEDLSPLSGHTAGIRAKLTKTAMKNESPKEAAPTDLCKRCNMLGQWAKNYTNSPFTTGMACKAGMLQMWNKGPFSCRMF